MNSCANITSTAACCRCTPRAFTATRLPSARCSRRIQRERGTSVLPACSRTTARRERGAWGTRSCANTTRSLEPSGHWDLDLLAAFISTCISSMRTRRGKARGLAPCWRLCGEVGHSGSASASSHSGHAFCILEQGRGPGVRALLGRDRGHAVSLFRLQDIF